MRNKGELQKDKFLSTAGLEPLTYRLRSDCAIHCATRSDSNNKIKIDQVLQVLFLVFYTYTMW